MLWYQTITRGQQVTIQNKSHITLHQKVPYSQSNRKNKCKLQWYKCKLQCYNKQYKRRMKMTPHRTYQNRSKSHQMITQKTMWNQNTYSLPLMRMITKLLTSNKSGFRPNYSALTTIKKECREWDLSTCCSGKINNKINPRLIVLTAKIKDLPKMATGNVRSVKNVCAKDVMYHRSYNMTYIVE
jgi:hypothetical protein